MRSNQQRRRHRLPLRYFRFIITSRHVMPSNGQATLWAPHTFCTPQFTVVRVRVLASRKSGCSSPPSLPNPLPPILQVYGGIHGVKELAPTSDAKADLFRQLVLHPLWKFNCTPYTLTVSLLLGPSQDPIDRAIYRRRQGLRSMEKNNGKSVEGHRMPSQPEF
jgi:hypothetical protein